MLKAHERSFALLQKYIDAAFVIIAWLIAYTIRFQFIPGGQEGLGALFSKLSPVIAAITLYLFYRNGLYLSQRFKTRYNEISTILLANSQAVIGMVIALYFVAPERLSRITIVLYWVLSSIIVTVERLLVRNYLRTLRRKGKNLRHVLLFGNGRQVAEYIKNIQQFRDAGIEIKGWVASKNMAKNYDIPAFEGTLSDAMAELRPDVLVAGFEGTHAKELEELVALSRIDLTPIQILPDLSYSFIGTTIEDFAGVPVITVNQPQLSGVDHFLKRAFDFISAVIGVLLISPILGALALAVKLTSKGPIFYGQERMSVDGETFKMWKFRSMRTDAEEKTGAVWAIKNDDRRTPIGTFLRSTSLDELPQLWNVVVGNMSLVGPRPERPVFIDKFKHEIPQYMLRHKMKSGITGWAQVNGWRGDTSLEKRIECDIYYIKHWSLWLDIKILFMTIWKGFVNKNAY